MAKKKLVLPPPAPPSRLGDVWPRALAPAHPEHRGSAVRVGPYEVLAGGTRDLTPDDLAKADLLIPLTGSVPYGFGRRYQVLAAPLVDYGGVPSGWREFLELLVIPELKAGTKVLAFCVGSHGRTGTFLASLIALLESATETPDPIAAARERHCHKAVETLAQAEAVFALRGEPLPEKYQREFYVPPRVFETGLAGIGLVQNWPRD